MNSEALVFLEGDQSARMLVTAWPQIEPAKARNGTLLAPEVNYEHWARIAGVPLGEAYRCAPVLFANGACKPEGGADEKALEVVRKFTNRRLGRRGRY